MATSKGPTPPSRPGKGNDRQIIREDRSGQTQGNREGTKVDPIYKVPPPPPPPPRKK